jgi:hypothetical protein
MDILVINILDNLLTPFRQVYFGLLACGFLLLMAFLSAVRMRKETAEILENKRALSREMLVPMEPASDIDYIFGKSTG